MQLYLINSEREITETEEIERIIKRPLCFNSCKSLKRWMKWIVFQENMIYHNQSQRLRILKRSIVFSSIEENTTPNYSRARQFDRRSVTNPLTIKTFSRAEKRTLFPLQHTHMRDFSLHTPLIINHRDLAGPCSSSLIFLDYSFSFSLIFSL